MQKKKKTPHHTLDREYPAKIKETKIIKLKVDKNITFEDTKILVEKKISNSGYADACQKSLPPDDKKHMKKPLNNLIQKLESMVRITKRPG